MSNVIALDVRPMLAAGDEPFSLIIETAGGVPPGGTLELTAPFDPVPLYPVMSKLGFGHETDVRAGDEVVVRFRQLGITPDARVSDVHARYPGTAPVLAELGVDLCCGGSQPLEKVAGAHGIELPRLLTSLQQAAMGGGPG